MKITIDLGDVKQASFTDKESGEVKDYKQFGVQLDEGAVQYVSMSGITKVLDGLKRIAG